MLPSEHLLTLMKGVTLVDENATFEAAGAPLPNDEVQGPFEELGHELGALRSSLKLG